MENVLPILLGAALGVLLLSVGILLGIRFGKRRLELSGSLLSENDREQMLQLLQQLGSWTSEYSGNVSGYQNELGKLSKAVEAVRDSDANSSPSISKDQIMSLVTRIMKSNENLQARLEAAEKQLDRQTKQIEVYLTEARTDSLTGLFNRRAFDKRAEDVFNAYRNGGRSFVIALIDIDKFKSINDTYGHQAGDKVLQQLAASLRGNLSGAIMLARFGGEEFSAILDGPLRVAAGQMEELRKMIANEPIDLGERTINLTISIGVSEPREDAVLATILRRSDEALYAAKNIGRNRVYYHDGRAPALVGAPEIAKSP